MRRFVPLIDQAPFLEHDLDWPSHVFVVEELGTGRYLCKLVEVEFGVSCIETALRAELIEAEDLRPLKIHHGPIPTWEWSSSPNSVRRDCFTSSKA